MKFTDFLKLNESTDKNYGNVTFKGKKYYLTTQAEPTSAVVPNGYNDVKKGEYFNFQMSAYAVDKDNNKYLILWIFSDVKGEEKDYDEFDYDDVYDVMPI